MELEILRPEQIEEIIQIPIEEPEDLVPLETLCRRQAKLTAGQIVEWLESRIETADIKISMWNAKDREDWQTLKELGRR